MKSTQRSPVSGNAPSRRIIRNVFFNSLCEKYVARHCDVEAAFPFIYFFSSTSFFPSAFLHAVFSFILLFIWLNILKPFNNRPAQAISIGILYKLFTSCRWYWSMNNIWNRCHAKYEFTPLNKQNCVNITSHIRTSGSAAARIAHRRFHEWETFSKRKSFFDRLYNKDIQYIQRSVSRNEHRHQWQQQQQRWKRNPKEQEKRNVEIKKTKSTYLVYDSIISMRIDSFAHWIRTEIDIYDGSIIIILMIRKWLSMKRKHFRRVERPRKTWPRYVFLGVCCCWY